MSMILRSSEGSAIFILFSDSINIQVFCVIRIHDYFEYCSDITWALIHFDIIKQSNIEKLHGILFS